MHASWVAITVLLVEWAIRLILAARVIMQRRPVPVALAWVSVLVFVPVLALIAYVLIGENRLGSRRLKLFNTISGEMDQQAVKLWKYREEDWTPEDADWQQISKLATAVSGWPPLKGNALHLIGNSEEMLTKLARDIDQAKDHCHLLFYIYTTTNCCMPVSEALVRAAQRGVACRVLVDAVGSKKFLRSECAAEMRKAGVKVVASLPVNFLRMLFARIDLRNHRKIVVIDGQIAYTGSQNLTDSTFRAGWNRKVGPWIDATVRITGPAAQSLQVVFLEDWQVDSGEVITSIENFLPPIKKERQQTQVVQVVPSGPGAEPAAIQQAFLTTVYAAKEELIITTPYFVPDEPMKSALRSAALRGVKVTLVMPSEIDSPLVAAASRAHWLDLLESGVRIVLYRGGLLHAKTVTVDRRIGLIGSANIDMRSFWLNFEITVILFDDDFASVLRFMQTSYIENSVQLSADEFRRRSRLLVFAEQCAKLAGPLL